MTPLSPGEAGWQTMDSAPRGDEEAAILIGRFGGGAPYWAVAYFEQDAKPDYPWHVEDAAKGFNYHKDWPTHWMPLPAPPSEPLERK